MYNVIDKFKLVKILWLLIKKSSQVFPSAWFLWHFGFSSWLVFG